MGHLAFTPNGRTIIAVGWPLEPHLSESANWHELADQLTADIYLWRAAPSDDSLGETPLTSADP